MGNNWRQLSLDRNSIEGLWQHGIKEFWRQGGDSPLPETLTLNFSEEKPERE